MNKQKAIYTESNNCQDCYKCIRHCPVKAIKIEDHLASVMYDLCVYCGVCTTVCPVGAKKIRNDIQTVDYFLQQKDPVYLSLAPSFISDFKEYSEHQFLGALRELGFTAVSETALGAEYLSDELRVWLEDQKNGVHISTCCPTIVELIQKYYPQHIDKLTPFASPLQIHARLIKRMHPNAKVVFAGPCIAKKEEVESAGNVVDAVLTFKELQEMLDSGGMGPEFVKFDGSESFYPFNAEAGKYYPIDGGMSNSLSKGVAQTSSAFMSFSGMSTVKALLENLPQSPSSPLFLELLACDGGCINGPGRISPFNIVQAREDVLKSINAEVLESTKKSFYQPVNVSADFHFNSSVDASVYSEAEITETLTSIGKFSSTDELNCGGCGYSTCKAFVRAILDGKAESQMCVSYMRKMAQNKASVLLHKMPYGVVIVDDKLKVIESNQIFASIWDESSRLAYEAKPGLEGVSIDKLTPLSRLFQNLLESGHERIERDLNHKGRLLHVSLFTIQKHKQVCAIVRVPGEHEVSLDDVIVRLKNVIRENMLTAQKAASVLGENAANTECVINTVIDSFTGGSSYEKDVY
ncbi:MAG: [Fe-Fe] hydrogenase large subunit C-terminal domain-containing protein [Bacteroidales bacterium]|nr:[Fe-Fe] hydrogenase large subunit C-terminal domain-containing protein [Tenuifilaceae bacterium]